MEVPRAEIELDLARSIKRRQIVGGTGKRGWRPKREESPRKREGGGVIDRVSRERDVKKKKDRTKRHSAAKRQRHHKSKTR